MARLPLLILWGVMAVDPKPVRSWRQIAAEVAQETDPEKLNKLTRELLQAMEEEKRQADARLH
ncbi:MAG TPA: hypothetical protein VL156_09405, partial [Terriglobales bacterium]|nr:hypothetical protein [Terriglobales bacterium]